MKQYMCVYMGCNHKYSNCLRSEVAKHIRNVHIKKPVSQLTNEEINLMQQSIDEEVVERISGDQTVYKLGDTTKHTQINIESVQITGEKRARSVLEDEDTIKHLTKFTKFVEHYQLIDHNLEYKPIDYNLPTNISSAVDLISKQILKDIQHKDLTCPATNLSIFELFRSVSPSLHCLLMKIICSCHRDEKNKKLHEIYMNKKANLTIEDKKLDDGYMKKFHCATIIAAQIHGAYSQKKFSFFKQLNTIVFEAKGLTYEQINNLNKIGLTQQTTLLTHHFDMQSLVMNFNSDLLGIIRKHSELFPLVQSNCDNCDHCRSSSSRPAQVGAELAASNLERNGEARELREKYQAFLDESKGDRKTNTSSSNTPLYRRTTSQLVQLLRFVPVDSSLSMAKPERDISLVSADDFYESRSDIDYKNTILEREILVRFQNTNLSVNSHLIRYLKMEELKQRRSAETTELIFEKCVGDVRNIIVLPSLLGPCESKKDNKIHTQYVLDILNYNISKVKPLRCGDQKVFNATRRVQSEDKSIYTYPGDLHFYFNVLGAICPPYSKIGLYDMCSVLDVKKNLQETKGKGPCKADYLLHVIYPAVFDYFISLYKERNTVLDAEQFLDWGKKLSNPILQKWWNFIINDAWLAVRIKESFRTGNWQLRYLCYKLGIRFSIENHRTNYTKLIMQHIFDIHYIIPRYYCKVLEYNFAVQSLSGDSFIAFDELMEMINKDLKEFNNTTPELIVRNSSNFNLKKVLQRISDQVFRTSISQPSKEFVRSEQILFLKKHLPGIFNKYSEVISIPRELTIQFEDENYTYLDDIESQVYLNFRNGMRGGGEDDEQAFEAESEDNLYQNEDYDKHVNELMKSLLDYVIPDPISYPSSAPLYLGRSLEEKYQEFYGVRSAEFELFPLSKLAISYLNAMYLNIIKSSSLNSLREESWINDEVIDSYFKLLQKRDAMFVDWEPSLFMPLIFSRNLLIRGYRSVARYTYGIDLFCLNQIFIPIHLNGHWCLVIVSFDKMAIQFFDSLDCSTYRKEYCGEVLKYLIAEYREKKGGRLDESKWTICCPDVPKQRNSFDCGVFMCQYANFVSQDLPLSFSQCNMPFFRQKMIYQLLIFSGGNRADRLPCAQSYYGNR